MLVCEVLDTPAPVTNCGVLWARLSPIGRLVWVHAACLPGDSVLADFATFTHEDKAALMVALENMVEFFQTVGELP